MSNKHRRWTLQQYLRRGDVSEVVLVKIEHPDGPVLLWDGLGILDHEGEEWKGLGRLGSVQIGPSDIETQINDVVFTLSGIDDEYVGYLESSVKGCKAWVWKAFLGPDYRVRFTEMLSESELDQPTFTTEPGGQQAMKIVATGGFYFLEVQSRAVWDVEEQRNYLISLSEDPETDTGFDMMSELKNLTVAWQHAEGSD